MGVNIDGCRVCILAYADGIVLIAESECELNVILDSLHNRCVSNKMNINNAKSNIVHFKAASVAGTIFVFTF